MNSKIGPVFFKQSINYNYIISNPLTFHHIILLYFIILYYITLYYIILHYIILHLTFILLLIYNLFKGSNGKVKLERSRLWKLDNSRREPCEGG